MIQVSLCDCVLILYLVKLVIFFFKCLFNYLVHLNASPLLQVTTILHSDATEDRWIEPSPCPFWGGWFVGLCTSKYKRISFDTFIETCTHYQG